MLRAQGPHTVRIIQNRMQEIKKRRIVIASVLKPVGDTRMFGKIGRSLSSAHEVHVIGFGAASGENVGVFQHPIGIFPRISLSRLLAPWRILNMILRLRPELLIVCTHELLWQALIARLLLKCRLWYDVQENYARNITSTHAFPPIIRSMVAAYARLKERIAAPVVERFLLAEQSYVDELPFVSGRSVVIENKVRRDEVPIRLRRNPGEEPLRLVFTGTLSELTGAFLAIDIAAALHEIYPVRLIITGFCPRISEREKLMARCRFHDFVTLNTGDVPVSHDAIMKSIADADVGIISYPANPSTWDCIPTKLYEYIASRLPILLIDNPRWVKLAARFNAAAVFGPSDFDPRQALDAILTSQFYVVDPQDVYWDDEERKLLSLV